MTEPTDHELLAEYARTGDEAPFARLVVRHINLVHSAARRYAGNDHLAEEITQAVFLILARKAGSLSAKTILSGWLYQTARLTTANALKADQRRQRREQEAYMQSQDNETDAAVWREIAPLLDDAMGKLGETDRAVLVLRFFERQTNAQVAGALGLAEGAVQKRVLRALEKLRVRFAQQGVTHSAQAIAGSVNRYAVLAAPAGLTAAIVTQTAKGAVIATTISTLTNGTLKTLAMTTIQKTLITAALVASVGVGIYQAKETAHARAEVQTLQQQQAPLAEQIQQLQAERDKATNTIAGLKEELAKSDKNKLELMKLRGEIGVLKNRFESSQSTGNSAEMRAKPKSTFSSFDLLSEHPDIEETSTHTATINFENVPADEALNIYGLLSKRTVIRGSLPDAKITVRSTDGMNRIQLLQLLDNVLAENGIAMVLVGDKSVKAVSVEKAAMENLPEIKLPVDLLPDSSSPMFRTIQLTNVLAASVIPIIAPFSKLTGSIVAIQDQNKLMFRDYSASIKRELKVLEQLEKDPKK